MLVCVYFKTETSFQNEIEHLRETLKAYRWMTITCSMNFIFQVFLKWHLELPKQLKPHADDFMPHFSTDHG